MQRSEEEPKIWDEKSWVQLGTLFKNNSVMLGDHLSLGSSSIKWGRQWLLPVRPVSGRRSFSWGHLLFVFLEKILEPIIFPQASPVFQKVYLFLLQIHSKTRSVSFTEKRRSITFASNGGGGRSRSSRSLGSTLGRTLASRCTGHRGRMLRTQDRGSPCEPNGQGTAAPALHSETQKQLSEYHSCLRAEVGPDPSRWSPGG